MVSIHKHELELHFLGDDVFYVDGGALTCRDTLSIFRKRSFISKTV